LQAEELIRGGRNGAQVVASVTAVEAEHIYDVRCLLEALAAKRFATLAPPEDIKALRTAFNAFRDLARGESTGNASLLDAKTEFYRILLQGCANPVIGRMLTLLHNRISLLRATSMARKGRLAETVTEVERIVAAIEKRDPEQAWTTTFEHVRNAADAALLVMRERQTEKGKS
jgi:DNA-binding GntR family transcriptional regulator